MVRLKDLVPFPLNDEQTERFLENAEAFILGGHVVRTEVVEVLGLKETLRQLIGMGLGSHPDPPPKFGKMTYGGLG